MMNYVYAAFLLLVVFFFLRAGGALPDDPIEADASTVELGVGLLIIVGVLAFRLGIWAKGVSKGSQPQQAMANTVQTPFQVMREVLGSVGWIVAGFTAFLVLMLELTGQHEELVQFLEFLQVKGDRLINALLH